MLNGLTALLEIGDGGIATEWPLLRSLKMSLSSFKAVGEVRVDALPG